MTAPDPVAQAEALELVRGALLRSNPRYTPEILQGLDLPFLVRLFPRTEPLGLLSEALSEAEAVGYHNSTEYTCDTEPLARLILRLLAQPELALAEVWMHPNGYAELMAVRGRFTEQDITELKQDLEDNAPGAGVLPEGLHLVPVEWNRYMDEDYTVVQLRWDQAVFQPLPGEVTQ